MIAIQILEIIEKIHEKDYIHRDLKPDNFLIGLGKNLVQINIIDFGVSKCYINPITGEHSKFLKNKDILVGSE